MTDTAVTTKKHPIVVLRERLEERSTELEAALPDDISPKQFVRAVMTSASVNPDILACTWPSLWRACMLACRDGLLPDGVEGALVPFKTSATWIPMYQGRLRAFRRSGQFIWVTANVVRAGEKFERFINETGDHMNHVPSDDFSAEVIKVYAAATTKAGGFFVATLPIAEIDKIKKNSRAQRDDAPWKAWPEEMMKKTALRRLLKLLPNARDLMISEDEPEAPTGSPLIDLPSAPDELPAGSGQTGGAYLEKNEASSPSSPSPARRSPEGGGGERQQQVAASVADDAARNVEDDASGAPAAADEIPQSVLAAFEAGKKSKAAGHLRKALPGEYRDAAHQREAVSWQCGYDGTPLPKWQQT